MDADTAIKGLLELYGKIWLEVKNDLKLTGMTPEMKKDVATSIFIQVTRAGIR